MEVAPPGAPFRGMKVAPLGAPFRGMKVAPLGAPFRGMDETLESELNGLAAEDEAGAAEEPSAPTKTPRGSAAKGGGAMGAIKKLTADKQALVAEKQALVARVAEVQKQADFHSTTVNEMQEVMIQRSETTQALKAQVKEFADALGVEPPPMAGATAPEANGASSGEDAAGASASSTTSGPGTVLGNIQALKDELEQLKKEAAQAKKLLGSSTQGGSDIPLVETIQQLAEQLGAGPGSRSDGPALATYAMQMVHDRHKLEALVGGQVPPPTPPALKAAMASGALLSSEMRGGEQTSSGGIAGSSGGEGSVGAKLLDRILQMQQERDAALKRAEAAEQSERELDRSLSALLKSHGSDASHSGGGEQDGGNGGEVNKEVLRGKMLNKVQQLQEELSMAQDAQQELLMHTKAMVDVLGGEEAEGDAEPEDTEGGAGKPGGGGKASSDIAMVRRMAKRAKRVSTMVVNGDIASSGATENLQVELQQVKGMKEELEQELEAAKKQIDKAGVKADGMFWENKRLGGAGNDEQAVARVKHAGVRLRDVCEMYKGMSELGKQVDVKVDSKHLISFMPAMPNDRLINPLNFMADYDIEILINNEPIGKFEVENGNTGIFQAAIHYFHIDTEAEDVSFDSALPPGSQSSNMIVDLVMRPAEEEGARCHYIAQKGDILGLCIRVRSIANHNGEIIQLPARELVYNNNVLRASEVVSAVPEDQKSKMTHISIWPDLTSSWRWQNTPEGWLLARVRWRFLLKKVFPDIADYVQTLATRGQGQ
ncbi:hypothetical protein CYMTET_25818 [Cymbomonas tetramitiformis]|uniref:Uncharacterized protein n=1 Tax=Cymbomonas tetramitiformis TaxID=36881 RepID=A0AAE0KYT0_9CHLO|nr:hypothetical protein CYMTET_25818 [Cymbomonas tetramitiformis]